MKAILLDDGDLEVILESETELKGLRQKELQCEICTEAGTRIDTQLILKYSHEEIYRDGITISP